jgi:MFS family permease
VRPLATEASLWNLGWEVFLLALTVEFLNETGHGPLLLGLVLACGGLGGLVGSLASASLTRRFGYGPSLVVTMVVGNSAPLVGVGAVALGAPDPATYMVALLVSGFGIGVANSQAITVRQLVVDEQLRGRVNSAYRLVGFTMLALGAAAGGFLVASLGAHGAAFAGCGLMTAACVPVALSPVRRMRTTSSLEEEAQGHPDPA